jgi:hypothetical protein
MIKKFAIILLCGAIAKNIRAESYNFAYIKTTGVSMWTDKPDSMIPGQMIEMVYKPFNEVKVGDIVVYWNYFINSRPILVCHRVVKLGPRKNTFYTQGDNVRMNCRVDPGVLCASNYVAVAIP